MEAQQVREVLQLQTQCPGRRVGVCGAQVSHLTAGAACAEKSCAAVCHFSLRPLGTERFLLRGMLGKEQQHLKKQKKHEQPKTSPVPLCDSNIFREICTLYPVGILKQGIGTSIIQELEQDVWKRQIDSWFVPNSWLYIIHHCQAWKQAWAHRHWLPGTVSVQQKLSGGTKLFRAVERCRIPSFSLCWGSCW